MVFGVTAVFQQHLFKTDDAFQILLEVFGIRAPLDHIGRNEILNLR
jgi:hypothetical protein